MVTNTETSPILLADLDSWNDAINALDAALSNAAKARAEINQLSEEIDLSEARATLAATGSNAEIRKATVTLALAEDPEYEALVSQNRESRQRLADAERRIVVLKERCRLLRSAATPAIES